MAQLEHSGFINAPVDIVFDFMNNPEKEHLWRPELVIMEKTSEGPVQVGTTFRSVTKFLGMESVSTSEVTEYELNKVAAVKITSGPFPYEVKGNFEAVDGGTNVRMSVKGQTKGLFKLFEYLLLVLGKKQMEKQLNIVKQILEN